MRPLDSVARARVEGAVPLAYQMAWRYARRRAPDVPVDELIAEALYGLTYAAGLFDEARGVPFGAYAALVIRHRLMQLVRSWRRAAARARPYPGRAFADDAPWEAADDHPAPDPAAPTVVREMCDRLRQVLPPRWYTILRLYHAEGRTCQEIGRKLGVTRQGIQHLLAQAVQAARRRCPDWVAAAGPSTA
jgi:RNA polymerase sigma factor (sigma-70 family)